MMPETEYVVYICEKDERRSKGPILCTFGPKMCLRVFSFDLDMLSLLAAPYWQFHIKKRNMISTGGLLLGIIFSPFG